MLPENSETGRLSIRSDSPQNEYFKGRRLLRSDQGEPTRGSDRRFLLTATNGAASLITHVNRKKLFIRFFAREAPFIRQRPSLLSVVRFPNQQSCKNISISIPEGGRLLRATCMGTGIKNRLPVLELTLRVIPLKPCQSSLY